MNKSKILPVNRQTGTPMPVKNYEKGIFIPKNIIFDRQLSPKAKGLYCIILAQSRNWQITIKGLVTQSGKTGRKAVQSGLKELVTAGYLELCCEQDISGKFQGKYYRLTSYSSEQQPQKVTDSPFLHSDNTFLHTDSPKRVSTRSSDVDLENYNNKTTTLVIDTVLGSSVCETGSSDDKTVLSATDYYPTLLENTTWKAAYIGQLLSDQTSLTTAQVDILLAYFCQVSSRSDTFYDSLSAVKRHFRNWFYLHLSKQSLVSYLEQHQANISKVRSTVFALVPHSENIFKKLKNRSYPSTDAVLRAIAALQRHHATYQQQLSHLSKEADKAFVAVLIGDIDKILKKVEKAQAQNQLSWFCGK